jgi:uncharacterized protein YndB with AHSA1/START domain
MREKPDTAPVRIVQTFDAPRDRVFDAWIEPDLLKK